MKTRSSQAAKKTNFNAHNEPLWSGPADLRLCFNVGNFFHQFGTFKKAAANLLVCIYIFGFGGFSRMLDFFKGADSYPPRPLWATL